MLRVLAALLLGLGTLTFPPIVNDLSGQVDRVVEVGASRSYSGGDKVLSWRGRSVQFDVHMASSLVGTATGVEVRSGSGIIPGFTASIASRSLSPTPYLRINLTPTQLPPSGEYRVRVQYPVQSGSPTEFPLRLLEVGNIDQVSVSPAQDRLEEGATYTFTAAGQRLGTATFRPSPELDQVQVLSRNDNQVQIRARVTVGGTYLRINGSDFYDENTPSPNLAIGYEGAYGLNKPVEPKLVVTALSTTTAAVGQTVTVSGSGLQRAGWQTLISYRLRYCDGASASTTGLVNCVSTVTPSSVSPTGVAFAVNADMKPSTLRVLLKADASLQSLGFDFIDRPFPQTLMVTGVGPLQISTVSPGLGGSDETWVGPGVLTLGGRNLVPDSPNETVVVTLGSRKLPIVRRRLEEGILEVDASGVRAAERSTLMVERSGGLADSREINVVQAPTVRGIVKTDGRTSVTSLQPYEQGGAYVLVGNNLCVPSATNRIHNSVRIDIGQWRAVPSTAPGGSTNPGSGVVGSFNGQPHCERLYFTVPNSVAPGTHAVQLTHIGGSVAVGKFTVGNPLATVQLQPLQVSQVRGGSVVNVTLRQVAVTDLEVRLTATSPLAVPTRVLFKAGEQRKAVAVRLRPRSRPGTGTITATVGNGGSGQVESTQVTLRR